jgi:hypothetical protein
VLYVNTKGNTLGNKTSCSLWRLASSTLYQILLFTSHLCLLGDQAVKPYSIKSVVEAYSAEVRGLEISVLKGIREDE